MEGDRAVRNVRPGAWVLSDLGHGGGVTWGTVAPVARVAFRSRLRAVAAASPD
jgi:hypothetical protein